ncbi:MAG: hypothetical protein AAGI71_11010 [Bacteroidota bacterium]
MTTTDRNLLYATLNRAATDEEFRQMALQDAGQAIKQIADDEGYEGVDPEDARSHNIFVENEADGEGIEGKDVFVLPAFGEEVTLSEEDLEAIAGGALEASLASWSTLSTGCCSSR